jgi:hypothetical protein
LFFTRSLSSSAIWLVFIFDGIFSGFFPADAPTSIFLAFPVDSPVSSAATLDEDAASFAAVFLGAGVLDLNRWAGPAKGSIGGGLLSLPMRLLAGPVPMLRPLVGLGATMTSMGGVIGFDFDLILFVVLVSAGGTVVVSAAALGELDAAPGVLEALLLLALAFAAGATSGATAAGATAGCDCLPITFVLFAALASAAFAAFSLLDNGGGARFSGIGAGFSFGAEFAFKSRAAFRVALTFSPFAFKNLPLTRVPSASKNFLILPLPDDGGGLPSGGGAIPAGVSGGPGCMCNTSSFFAP